MTGARYNVQMNREDNSTPWGFRLEGGIDVGHAINIQRVAPGSLAEMHGLRAGDHVVQINSSETKWMRHDDAKMEIIRSGNDIDLIVERGVRPAAVYATNVPVAQSAPPPISPTPVSHAQPGVWRPKIVSTIQMPGSIHQSISPTSYTSLEATHQQHPDDSIGVSHNATPIPFGASVPPGPGQAILAKTGEGRFRKIGHSTYNSPMGLYNQRNLNQTFERTVSAATNNSFSPNPAAPQGHDNQGNQPSSMYCGSCGEFIRGVFVKVQGRIPMHPGCLKCCKCGVGLRNVGYFYIKEQLYCETHAKQAAPPPEPGMRPVVVYK